MQGGAQGKKIRAAQAAGDVLVLLCMPRKEHRGVLLVYLAGKPAWVGLGVKFKRGLNRGYY